MQTAALPQVCDRRSPIGAYGDDVNVRVASRLVGVFGAVVCMLAAAVMCVASFLPYTGGNWGDGLNAPTLITISIVSGSDVWLVLGTVAALALVAAYHLGGARRPAAGFIALALALVTLGLAIKLPSTWKLDGVTYGEPYLLFAGFYVFLGGAVAAIFGALLMVASAHMRRPRRNEPLAVIRGLRES